MCGEDEFHRHATDLVGHHALGVDGHALTHRGLAGRHGLAVTVDLDHAETTAAHRLEVRVLAQVRDEDAVVQGRIQNGGAPLGLDLPAVDSQLHVMSLLGSSPVRSFPLRRAQGKTGPSSEGPAQTRRAGS